MFVQIRKDLSDVFQKDKATKHNRVQYVILLICFLLIFPMSSAVAVEEGGSSIQLQAALKNRIDKVLKSRKNRVKSYKTEAIAGTDKKIRVIVKLKDQSQTRVSMLSREKITRKFQSQDNKSKITRIAERFRSDRVKVRNKYSYISAFSAEVSFDGLDELIEDQEVDQIIEDKPRYPSTRQGLPLVEAPRAQQIFGGAGVAIAILDSGVDYYHPALGGAGFPNQKVIGGTDTAMNDPDPMDEDGHGTAVAGIAAGTVVEGGDGDYIGGVAPDAKIYALKIADSSGIAWDSDILEAVEWSITHQYDDPANPITIINLSYGSGWSDSPCDTYSDPLVPLYLETIENATNAGITFFASSGNDGFTDGISFPACFSGIVSVGEVYDGNASYPGPWVTWDGSCTDPSTQSDRVVCYSNSAPFLDLLAPGADAYVPDMIGKNGYSKNDYFPNFGGTSAASPYAAGVAALVQSAAIAYNGAFFTTPQLIAILKTNGDSVVDPKNGITTPRVNTISSYASFLHPADLVPAGDVNGDGFVDLQDVILSLKIITGQTLAQPNTVYADLNDNGVIGLEESIYAMRRHGGLVAAQSPGQSCSPATLEQCVGESSCVNNGGYWYKNSCYVELICNPDDLELCTSEAECSGIGGDWHNGECVIVPASEVEPNDNKSNAGILVYNKQLTARLDDPGDVDWFKLSTIQSEVVTVYFSAENLSGRHWLMSVYNSDETLLARYDLGDGDYFHLSLASGDDYYFEVKTEAMYDGQNYQVLINSHDGQSAPNVESENNDISFKADQIVMDQTVSGQFLSSLDPDWYEVNIAEPMVLNINLATDAQPPSSSSVLVKNPNSQNIAFFHGEGSLNFDVAIPTPGVYKFEVDTYENHTYRQYGLTVSENEGLTFSDIEIEFNSNITIANPIALGQEIKGNLMVAINQQSNGYSLLFDDQDWYELVITEPLMVTLSFSSPDAINRFRLHIQKPDDSELIFTPTQDDWSTEINMNLPGTYYIGVKYGPHNITTDFYTISINAN